MKEFLWGREDSKLSPWKLRYFHLTDELLEYYDAKKKKLKGDEKQTLAKRGEIRLLGLAVRGYMPQTETTGFSFGLTQAGGGKTKKKEYLMRVDTFEDQARWMEALKARGAAICRWHGAGWLEKTGAGGISKGWKLRHFKLFEDRLTYSVSELSTERGSIPLLPHKSEVSINREVGDRYVLTLIPRIGSQDDRKYHLSTGSQREFGKWVAVLAHICAQPRPSVLPSPRLPFARGDVVKHGVLLVKRGVRQKWRELFFVLLAGEVGGESSLSCFPSEAACRELFDNPAALLGGQVTSLKTIPVCMGATSLPTLDSTSAVSSWSTLSNTSPSPSPSSSHQSSIHSRSPPAQPPRSHNPGSHATIVERDENEAEDEEAAQGDEEAGEDEDKESEVGSECHSSSAREVRGSAAGTSRYCFAVLTQGKPYVVAASSDEKRKKWIEALQMVSHTHKFAFSCKEGLLCKRGKLNTALKSRYFVLLPRRLLYFRSKADKHPAGAIALSEDTIVTSNTTDLKTEFSCFIQSCETSRVFQLVAPDAASYSSWLHTLRAVVRAHGIKKEAADQMSGPERSDSGDEAFSPEQRTSEQKGEDDVSGGVLPSLAQRRKTEKEVVGVESEKQESECVREMSELENDHKDVEVEAEGHATNIQQQQQQQPQPQQQPQQPEPASSPIQPHSQPQTQDPNKQTLTGEQQQQLETIGKSLLHAVQNGGVEDVEAMIAPLAPRLAQGALAHTDENGGSALLWAAWAGHIDMMKVLVAAKADVDQRNAFGKSPLLYAVRDHGGDMVQFLLDAKADPNIEGPEGEVPLMVAAKKGRTAAAKQLLEAKADVEAADEHNATSLLWATKGSYTETVRLLLAHGADVGHLNKYGKGATYYANRGCKEELVEVLVAATFHAQDDELVTQASLKALNL